jgi:pyrimidine-nucleoside phosphorylase
MIFDTCPTAASPVTSSESKHAAHEQNIAFGPQFGPMNFLPLIEAKRDGSRLSAAELREMVGAYTSGQIPDYQMAAFLMAVCFRGLDRDETSTLTLAMRDSGKVLSFPADARPLVDKHSTGGVGDKVSLPLAPLLACLGFRVPMISGRGLGITGGTLDKLESIPGFRTLLPAEMLIETVQRVGCAICGQAEDMVPADRKLYALRDVTGTVPSIPLIVASILSKKLAEGISALVLDVKFGAAAFMRDIGKARELATAMVTLGNSCGVKTRALLTAMDVPLGRAAGNWIEVKESLEVLEGKGPRDLRRLVIACAAQLLVQTEKSASLDEATQRAETCLESGIPRKKWDEMLEAQGADLEAVRRLTSGGPLASTVLELKASRSGYISSCNARTVGEIVRDLGGGRFRKDSVLDHAAGVDGLAKPGDQVRPGDLLGRIHARSPQYARQGLKRLESAFEVSDGPPPPAELITEVV